jgi:hypothetical protein
MIEHEAGRLRIYADFNSCIGDDRGTWCWLLRYNGKLLDEVAASLEIHDGMSVTLYYEDPGEEFEVDAILGHVANPGWDNMWVALPDWATICRLRG